MRPALAGLVLIGVAAAGGGAWWATRSPGPSAATPVVAGAYRDVQPLDRDRAVAVRTTPGLARSTVELFERGHGTRWQASVPVYAGNPQVPGLAVAGDVIVVRVVRDGHAEAISLRATDGATVATLPLTEGWPASPGGYSLDHVMSVSGAARAYEFVGDEQRGAVVAVSPSGAAAWRSEFDGKIELAIEVGAQLAVVVGGTVVLLDAATGATLPATEAPRIEVGSSQGDSYALTSDIAAILVPSAPRGPVPPVELVFDPRSRVLTSADRATGAVLGAIRWPADALAPEPHHYRDGVVWLVFPGRLATLDVRTLAITATSDGAPLELTRVE